MRCVGKADTVRVATPSTALAFHRRVLSRPAADPATNLVTGTVTRYLVLALNVGVGVVLMPFTVGHLGQTEYGLWMLVASLTTYFQLLDLGYGNGVVRHLVEADRRGDTEEVNRIASTFVCVYSVIAVVACIAIGVMARVVVPRFPRLTPAQVSVAQVLLVILGARVAIGFPLTVFGAVTNARQGFVLNNLVASATVIASAICTYVVLKGGGGLLTLVATTTAINILGYAGYAWTAYRVMPELHIRPSYFSAARWRDVTSFSLYLFVINLAGQISFNIDNVVIGAVLGPAAVAVYTIALRMSEYQRRMCDQFSGMLFPVAMAFGTDGDRRALKRTLVEGNRIAMTLVAGAAVCLIGFSGPLIARWMGPAFAGSVTPFNVLAVASVIVVSQAASPNVLIAVGRHRIVTWIWIVEAAANLVLSVVLVHKLGLVGVAVGTLVPLVFGHLGVMLTAASRAVGMSVARCAYETTRPAVVAAFIAACACALVRAVRPPSTATALVVEAMFVALAYITSLATVGFDRSTRRAYASQLRRAAAAAASAVVPQTGRRATNVDPDGPLSSSVSVP
jgi:O-antigen/teichoic acid export membrane protein